eukprot:sb/3473726/
MGNKAAQRNNKITLTILQLTLIFVVCNTAHTITLMVLEILRPEQSLSVWYTLYCSSNLLPFLNSLLNPCILIIRGKTLRNHVKGVLGVTASEGEVTVDNDIGTENGGVKYKLTRLVRSNTPRTVMVTETSKASCRSNTVSVANTLKE